MHMVSTGAGILLWQYLGYRCIQQEVIPFINHFYFLSCSTYPLQVQPKQLLWLQTWSVLQT